MITYTKLTTALRTNDLSYKWLWGKWALVTSLVSFIYLLTIDSGPYLHSDEFMTLELGRIILHADTDWSIAWMPSRDKPVLVWFYIGPVLQELAFQVLGPYGPRVLGIIGAVMAATAVVGWLLSKGTSRNAALLLGLVFLLDPIFVQSYTVGRVDNWTIALCITSCWILSHATHQLTTDGQFRRRVMQAGGLAAVAFFTWPSALFLFPLLLLELNSLAITYSSATKTPQKRVVPFVWFGIGSLVVGMLIVIPIAPRLYAQFNEVMEGLTTNTRSGPPEAGHSFYQNTIELFRVLKFTPIILLIALFGVVKRKSTGLLIAGLVAVLLMISTLVYINRVQYLLPYFIAAVAGIYQERWVHKHHFKPVANSMKLVGLTLLLVWSIGLSLVARSILAFDGRVYRDRNLLYQAAQSMIGPGNYAVLLPPLEFYYAGRSLGWRMYKPYIAYGDTLSPQVLQRILPRLDYVIVKADVSQGITNQLKAGGMYDEGNYYIYKGPEAKFDGKTTNITRLRNLYSIFWKPYGPYKLYARKNKITKRLPS